MSVETLRLSALPASRCAGCGADLAANLLACPGCRALVHGPRIKQLVDDASNAAASGDVGGELRALNAALTLLPPGSRQHAAVRQRLEQCAPAVHLPSPTNPAPTSGFWKWVVGLGPIGLILFKLKFLIVALIANGKFLLLGLTKASTVFSMFVALGVYWTAWGIWFALGFILSIYIHEMGHVVALTRYGIAASAPMFIPGLGAFIRLQASLPPAQNARVGLAGPHWGFGAALVALLASSLAHSPFVAAIAHTGAWLNLFNLLPVWQLDGNRAFAALSHTERLTVSAAFVAAALMTGQSVLLLIAAVAAVRAFDGAAPDEGDRSVTLQFVALIAGLSLVLWASPPA